MKNEHFGDFGKLILRGISKRDEKAGSGKRDKDLLEERKKEREGGEETESEQVEVDIPKNIR